MKKLFPLLVASLLLSTGCKKQTKTDFGEECSFQSNDIHYTKSVNKATEYSSKTGNGSILMKASAKTDFFNAPDSKTKEASAPILLTEIDNTKPFTYTVKLTPQFLETYDAGTLYVFENSDIWQKFAFEMDERKNTRIVTVRTMDTSDDNNHDIVQHESVYLKISSDTKIIGFYYSPDKENWYMARLYKNNYSAKVWLGLSSQSPMGNGNQTIFDEASLTDSAIKDFRMGI